MHILTFQTVQSSTILNLRKMAIAFELNGDLGIYTGNHSLAAECCVKCLQILKHNIMFFLLCWGVELWKGYLFAKASYRGFPTVSVTVYLRATSPTYSVWWVSGAQWFQLPIRHSRYKLQLNYDNLLYNCFVLNKNSEWICVFCLSGL